MAVKRVPRTQDEWRELADSISADAKLIALYRPYRMRPGLQSQLLSAASLFDQAANEIHPDYIPF
jgi:hypothetical protein